MHYEEALFSIRKYNPDLQFRNRDPNELLSDLDKAINYTIDFPFAYKNGKWEHESFFVYSLTLAATVLFIISLALSSL